MLDPIKITQLYKKFTASESQDSMKCIAQLMKLVYEAKCVNCEKKNKCLITEIKEMIK